MSAVSPGFWIWGSESGSPAPEMMASAPASMAPRTEAS